MNIIIFGPPGSGKGTQANKLSSYYRLPHISTGDILRNNFSLKTDIWIKAKKYIEEGFLVPDEILIKIIKERLHNKDCNDGYILDGYPRTINQAKALDNILKSVQKSILYVFNINIKEEELFNRLLSRMSCSCGCSYHKFLNTPKIKNICDKCGQKLYTRTDDELNLIKNRLNIYKLMTEPIINYYKNKNILYDINGMNSIDNVFSMIINICNKI